ncbi:MAG: DUF2062 domain-containing protein [Leptospiraceae bacterium]|nr:DUF2062 domain-containing protein [Leptospiraceae bacterium]MDW7975770.1 DUF2062 domain-containing protein [Leptospiraceae bacterium]
MFNRIYNVIYQKIIYPLKEAHSPRSEIALGAAIGMFWALNPLVGVQMYLVTLNWLILKFFKIRFHLPIALAMVWITNPLTLPFFYYSFYVTGIFSLKIFNLHYEFLSFDSFKLVIEKSISMSLVDGLVYWIEFLINDFGIPALIGSLIWAVPFSIITYPLVFRFITKHRERLAKKEGITLEEWEQRHIHTLKEIFFSKDKPKNF